MLDVIPDEIPRHLIKERKYWRTDGSHMFNQINLIPHIYRSNVPYRYLAAVCDCGDKREGVAQRGRIPVCATCRKPFAWFLHYCMVCGKVFIRDFGDPRYCDLYPTCWDCLPLLPWDSCTDHSSIYDGARNPNAHPPFPPVGLNPRTYTAEELENVFDF